MWEKDVLWKTVWFMKVTLVAKKFGEGDVVIRPNNFVSSQNLILTNELGKCTNLLRVKFTASHFLSSQV